MSFGPRVRSNEHIIPESLFGRIVTRDLCKPCNDLFGQTVDHALVKDGRIVDAATRAGFKLDDLLDKFEGEQETSSGAKVRMLFKDGKWSPLTSLSPTADLRIPLDGWLRNRGNVKGALIAKVVKKQLPMTRDEIAKQVENLLCAAERDPGWFQVNSRIGEGFRMATASGSVTVASEYAPWETDWCLTKIVFELSVLLWPREYQSYCDPVLKFLRDFLEQREHDPSLGCGKGIFDYVESCSAPEKVHRISGLVSPTRVKWSLTFFGTASWSWEVELDPERPPPGNGHIVTITNPCEPTADSRLEVICAPI